MKNVCKSALLSIGLVAASAVTPAAAAPQFSYLDPNYVQEIYTGPLVLGFDGPGMAWTVSGHLLTRSGGTIKEYSPIQNFVHQGTPLHGVIASNTVSGLASSGIGMTAGHDGYIYAVTAGGLQRFDPSNWSAPAQNLAGTAAGPGWGITTLPDGRIAYAAGFSGPTSNEIYIYDPSSGTNSLIYTTTTLIDDMEANSSGQLVLAGQGDSTLLIISTTGLLLSTISTAHYPDGLAFGNGSTFASIYANNNDGTITEYVFGAGYSAAPTAITDIATGSGAYGDLAAVGPDCAFYVSQFENGSYHGATPGIGTHWDNGVTNGEASIVRIARKDGSCGFAPSGSGQPVPEPGSLWLLLLGLIPPLHLLRLRRGIAAARA